MVDKELRLWRRLWDAAVISTSLSTHSHTDRLNGTIRRTGHILQLLSNISTGAHLAGVTMSGLLQCSGVTKLSVFIVSVSESGARWLMPTGTAVVFRRLARDNAMSAPRPGRWVTGNCTEYLECVDKVFADAISTESNVSYNDLYILQYITIYSNF